MMGVIKLQERRVSPEIMAEAAEMESSHSKDEIYVDSRAWLGSDSEDDYHSVKEHTPSTPTRTRMCIKNIYYNNTLQIIPPQPPTPTPAMTERKQKPLVELLKDPYWNEQQIIKEGKRQMRLVEFFIEDSFWEKEFSLKEGNREMRLVGNGKRVLKDEPKRDGCCVPSFGTRFWSKKRKTKATVS